MSAKNSDCIFFAVFNDTMIRKTQTVSAKVHNESVSSIESEHAQYRCRLPAARLYGCGGLQKIDLARYTLLMLQRKEIRS
jgi:hypothetical protein